MSNGPQAIHSPQIEGCDATFKLSIQIPPQLKHTAKMVATVPITTMLNATSKGTLLIPSFIWNNFISSTHKIKIKPPRQA
jgi:hypothetical protein